MCDAPVRERDPIELARLHVPSRDWSTLMCDRCDRHDGDHRQTHRAHTDQPEPTDHGKPLSDPSG